MTGLLERPSPPAAAGTIPFGRPMIGDAERDAVQAVLAGPTLTHGPRVAAFESAFAAFTGAPHALAVSSCTAALHLCWLHLGLGPGDEVIVPAQTHVATAHAVELCGARPVFVDCEPRAGNVDPDGIEAAVTPRTRAICVVHFLGVPVDMDRVLEIAGRRGLLVVEDCALALGARQRGAHVGLRGDAGCFSFYPVKHVTTGEGGMLVTRHEQLARDVARRRAFGIDRSRPEERPRPGAYEVETLGSNYRMPEIAAAIGVEQMRRLPGFLERRRANDAALRAGLRDVPGLTVLGRGDAADEPACYACAVVLDGDEDRRDRVLAALAARGVGTSVYYPRPVPLMPHYRERPGSQASRFPHAARLSATSITLPVGPHLDERDVRAIVAAVADATSETA